MRLKFCMVIEILFINLFFLNIEGDPIFLLHQRKNYFQFRCNSLIKRVWTFTDTCGQQTKFDQLVKILPIQDPDSPKKGQVNVDLWYQLEWPEYPNSQSYRLFVWPLGGKRGSRKPIETSRRWFIPSRSEWYPSNTKMLWQVEYLLNDGVLINDQSAVPSPVWGFTTRRISDLSATLVQTAPEVFTGRVMQVTWQVENTGSGQNFNSYYWTDKVFLTKLKERNTGLLTKYVRQNRILFPGDGYTATVQFRIPKDMIGEYYVVVISDLYGRLVDENQDNNKMWTVNMVNIRLTPPPDLIVAQVTAPNLVFSGNPTHSLLPFLFY